MYEKCVVEYDVTPELAAYQQKRPPGWEKILQTIAAEGCFPQRV
jgi:hypothetical protein